MVAFQSGRCLLRDRLKDAGLTQAELSKRLQMPISQISDWIHNRKRMNLDNAKTVSYILGCSIEDLFEWSEIRVSERKRRREQE